MNRYKFLLNQPVVPSDTIGLFPWGTIIDSAASNITDQYFVCSDEGSHFLNKIASTTSVVLFINQFKLTPLSMADFQELANSIEGLVKQHGVTVKGTYWAPGFDQHDPYVVPNPGMFRRATENIGINWSNIKVLSAFDDDLVAAKKVKAIPIKIGSNKNKSFTSFKSILEWADS